jgi:hypothetical protein
MNERIKELAEEAGINKDVFQISGTPIKYIVDELSLEKFAELIAREAINVAYKLCEQREISGEHYVEGGAESQGCAEAIRERGVDNEQTN